MRTDLDFWLRWTPRVLAILFAGFLSLFALDSFSEGRPLGESLLGFLIHLIPTYLVLAALAVGWRWGWIGALGFVALGVAYIVMAWGRFPIETYLVISGPLFVLGVLFALSWWYPRLHGRGAAPG